MQTSSLSCDGLAPPKNSRNKLPSPPHATIGDLLASCKALLEELSELGKFLVDCGKDGTVDTRTFQSALRAEFRSLQRVASCLTGPWSCFANTVTQISAAGPFAPTVGHATRSSNFPFYQAVWNAAKSTRGLVVLSKRFYWDTASQPQPNKAKKGLTGRKPKRASALVDVVAREGEEWIKVSTITEARLLFQMAKVGWGIDPEDEGGGQGGGDGKVLAEGMKLPNNEGCVFDADEDEDDDRFEILKIADDLLRASKATRVHYKHPQVRLVLPKIVENRTPAIDDVVATIRATGIIVDCLENESLESSFENQTDTRPLKVVFAPLIPSPHPNLTPTLNIDCTVLLALVSELSHSKLLPQINLHKAINRQIVAEASDRLLPSSIYPAFSSRSLVCSTPAAQRMREIVDQIGTPGEKARANIFMGEGAASGKSEAELRSMLEAQSFYPVPEELKLPIKVVQDVVQLSELPEVAAVLEPQLSLINRSVFFLGWSRSWITVTSNRTVAKLIESVVEERGGRQCIGPTVWICGPARSLVGKEAGLR